MHSKNDSAARRRNPHEEVLYHYFAPAGPGRRALGLLLSGGGQPHAPAGPQDPLSHHDGHGGLYPAGGGDRRDRRGHRPGGGAPEPGAVPQRGGGAVPAQGACLPRSAGGHGAGG